jgi:hypothetical protein
MPTLSDSDGVSPKSKCKIVGMQKEILEYDHFYYFERLNIVKRNTYGLLASTLFKFKTEGRPLIGRY